MRGVAGAGADDGVILILAIDSGTSGSAVLVAADALAQVPAPRPLPEVAANRAVLADGGSGDRFAGEDKHRKAFANRVVRGDRGESSAGADADRSVRGRGDSGQVCRRCRADKDARTVEPGFQGDQEVRPRANGPGCWID